MALSKSVFGALEVTHHFWILAMMDRPFPDLFMEHIVIHQKAQAEKYDSLTAAVTKDCTGSFEWRYQHHRSTSLTVSKPSLRLDGSHQLPHRPLWVRLLMAPGGHQVRLRDGGSPSLQQT